MHSERSMQVSLRVHEESKQSTSLALHRASKIAAPLGGVSPVLSLAGFGLSLLRQTDS